MSNQHDTIQLYLDSADTNLWARLWPLGLFYGITTNPKIIHQAGLPCTLDTLKTLADQAFKYDDIAEFHAQVWGDTADDMLEIGHQISEIHPSVIVKVPATRDGFVCASQLIEEGISVTMTAVYTTEQVVASAVVGADYAAPYLGRINDSGADGIATLKQMQAIVADSSLDLLVASLRSASEIATLAAAGLRYFTFTPELAYSLIDSELTTKAVADFEQFRQDSLQFDTQNETES